MMQPALVRRVTALTLLLSLAAAGAAMLAGSPRAAGGVAAGAVMGLLPIVTWAYLGRLILPRQHPADAPLKPNDRNGAKADPLMFGVISLGKLMLYAVVLIVLIGRNLVDPLAFAGALLAPSLILAVCSVRRNGARA